MTLEEFKEQEIIRMLDAGKSTVEIAESLGISRQSVYNWLIKNGYKNNNIWERS